MRMNNGRIGRIDSARQGDGLALALLMEEAWPVVFRFLRGLGVPDADASDLVQESLIRGMTHLNRYKPEKSDLHTWLCTIARNLFLDLLKKRRRMTSLETLPEESRPISNLSGKATGIPTGSVSGGMQFTDDADMDVRDLDLRDQLERLPEEVRFAVLMHYVHGYTNKAVARMLGIPEGTVKSKVHYGLGKLRKELADHAG